MEELFRDVRRFTARRDGPLAERLLIAPYLPLNISSRRS